MVASKAISDSSPLAGRAWIYLPRLVSVRVWDLRPLERRFCRSRGASILSGSIVSPILTGLPPSHQVVLAPSKTSPLPASAGASRRGASETVFTRVFFYPRSPPSRLRTFPHFPLAHPLHRLKRRPAARSFLRVLQQRSQIAERDRA
jgi:hypothetical protein